MEFCKPRAIRGSVCAFESYQWYEGTCFAGATISKDKCLLRNSKLPDIIHYRTNECFMKGFNLTVLLNRSLFKME
jgi:hypothetical protein